MDRQGGKAMRERWEGNPQPPERQEDKPPPPPMWQQGEVGKARQGNKGRGREGNAVPWVGEIKKLTISKIWQTSLHQVLE